MAGQTLIQRTTITIDDLRAGIDQKPDALFAILDACDEPRIPEKVGQLGARAVSLYKGDAERDYWAIAPYLAIVDHDLLGWIVENLWRSPWGILALAVSELDALRQHFRRFVMVKDAQAKPMFFRFYDPRVLPTFVETCDARELKEFYGSVQAYAVPATDREVSVFTLEGSAAGG